MFSTSLQVLSTICQNLSSISRIAAILGASALIGSAHVTSAAAAAEQKSVIEGVWFDSKGDGAVRLFRCGKKLCGRIVWIKDPFQKSGAPWVDGNNPSITKRKRPICGLQIVGGLNKVKVGKWGQGWIYDPKVGKEYSVQLTLASRNVLKVRGYLALLALGQTRTWKRATKALPKCSKVRRTDQRDAKKIKKLKAKAGTRS